VRRIARRCFRRRRLVVALWLLALVGLTAASGGVGTAYSNDFQLPNTESARALDLLKKVVPAQSGATAQIVVGTTDGAKISDPAVRSRVEQMLREVGALPNVTEVVSPYSPAGRGQVGRDGTVAFATVTYSEPSFGITVDTAKKLVDTAESGEGPGVHVAVAGLVAERANPQPTGGTGIGIIAAGIVLFLVFGSLFAMGLPLVSAIVALGSAMGLIGLLSHVLRMPDFSDQLVLLVGLGVGVDYALFIVSRHRQGLLAGRDVESSAVTSLDTSGRAVLFAGIVVCIALLGMFALGIGFLFGLAVAASIGVLFTMAAAVTLLPALLGFLGPRVLSRRQRAKLARSGPIIERGSGSWDRWATRVERAPWAWGTAALIVVLLLAAPFLSLRLGSSDQGNDPKGTTTREAYDLLARGFGPGFNGPLQITAEVPEGADPAAIAKVEEAIRTTPGVVAITPPASFPAGSGGSLVVFEAYPRGSPQDAATMNLISRLRDDMIPKSVGGSDLTVYVGGITAIFADFADVLAAKLPLFVGVVVGLSFLLLALVFRSILVPLKAAVMNLLSVAAAFGVITAVFQWGWLGSLFGVSRTGPVEAFLPVMMFAILFGLSMDYEVFLVMRIHEEWLRRGDNREAVRAGLAATGRTITAAAAIMVVVFASFVLAGDRIIKEFGLGLAVAVLVDAVIIRSALVPSIMLLMGKANWWFPRRLDRWLPRIHVEPEDLSELDELGSEAGELGPEPDTQPAPV
jgi:RND superfamily putative drug exporter